MAGTPPRLDDGSGVMGYVSVMGSCVRCERTFMFSPTKVPSILINGKREPLCEDCVKVLNPIRTAHGLPPIRILPGAYEADDENEVPWDD